MTKIFHIFFCVLFVAVIYSFSLARPWLPFDERIIYDNLYFPVPKSFGHIFEIFTNFGFPKPVQIR